MTELIKAQLTIVCVMGGGGLAAGLVYDVFETFISLRRWRGWRRWSLEIFAFLCIGFLTGEFLYAADRGKLTFLSICAFACGLWLYKKFFCDTMSLHSDWQAKGADRTDARQVPERRRLANRR